jgi:hypothetical protein
MGKSCKWPVTHQPPPAPDISNGKKPRPVGMVITGPDEDNLTCKPFYFPFNSNDIFCTKLRQVTLKLVGQPI